MKTKDTAAQKHGAALEYQEALELLDMLQNFAYKSGFHECGYDPVQRLRGVVALNADLLAALGAVANTNTHYGAGPHCTCSQGAREAIATAALAKAKGEA